MAWLPAFVIHVIRRILPHRSPLVLQREQVDCGPAALLSVLRYWGGDASLAEVRDLAGTDVTGTRLQGLRTAAGLLGLEARGATGSYEDLMKESMPCIAHLVMEDRRAHYVVVQEVDRRRVRVGDPARGRLHLSRAEFESLWRSRSVLLIKPTPRLAQRPAANWIHWILPYFQPHRSWLAQSLALGAATTTLGLLTAAFVQVLIDRFIPERHVEMILVTGLVLLVLLVLRAGMGFLRQRFLLRIHREVSTEVNEELLEHLFNLPYRFFQRRTTGDITARLADGVRIQGALLTVLGAAVIDGLVVVGSFAFLFVMAPPIGWIAAATIPLYLGLLVRATLRLGHEQNAVMSAYAGAESSYIDSLSGISEVLGFGAETPFVQRSASLYKLFQLRAERLGLFQAAISMVVEMVGGLLIVIVLVWGALLVVVEALLLGQLMAGYSLLAGMLHSVERLVGASIAHQEAAAAAERIRDLLLTPAENRTRGRAFVVRRELSLERAGVTWPSGHQQFRDIELALPRGCITGLWGPNGAGKTTLVHVFARTVELSEGMLRVDDTPADSYALEDYRRRVTVVPESVKLFHGTVGFNLTLGRRLLEPRKALDQLRVLGLGIFVDEVSERWDTTIGDAGHRLSAGERQIIGLMRALMTLPDVLLVDEGLSSADESTAKRILDALVRYGTERAVLIISHDPRVLACADRVYQLRSRGVVGDDVPRGSFRSSMCSPERTSQRSLS